MERAGEIVKMEGDAVRFVALRRAIDHARKLRDLPDHIPLAGVGEKAEIGSRQSFRREIRLGKGFAGLAEDRGAARMRVLDVEDRVVARLLQHLFEVEIEGGVVL